MFDTITHLKSSTALNLFKQQTRSLLWSPAAPSAPSERAGRSSKSTKTRNLCLVWSQQACPGPGSSGDVVQSFQAAASLEVAVVFLGER